MFKKIKSLFVVEDSVSTEAAPENNGDGVNATGSAGTSPTSISEINPVGSPAEGKPDPKFTDLLLKAIEASNMEGFDYLEFKNSLRSIENVIPDESMRFKSAFEMAKTMGLSKEKLIQSANHYMNVLVNEDKKFKDALENQKARQIQGRADQLAAVEKAMTDKQQMIDKLLKEIEASRSQLDSIRKEIHEAVIKIDMTNQQFVASYNLVYAQIYEDTEKIKTNI